ncbi:putative DNA-binding domain-containing protein [Alicycliphilus denitrificans]|uniref:HvfC/BufC family peptide modification chaperone n=1 Tax=Alicycliphilus denitrificans TaxID=179636 RepID=UPI0038500089
MYPRLTLFQDGLAAALRPGGQGGEPPAWLAALVAQPGFAVYRNTVAQGCLDALRANYPTVCQLLGADCFDAMALDFVRHDPPVDGRLMLYGAGLADYLTHWQPAAELPYLADVARLDRLWSESHTAADAPRADPTRLAALAPEMLGALHLRPHPAARWLWCSAHPAYTLWQRHREALPLDAPLSWQGEGALLTRPAATVRWCALDAAGCTLLEYCALGLPLGEAAAAALQAHPGAELGTLLARLLQAGALSPDFTSA